MQERREQGFLRVTRRRSAGKTHGKLSMSVQATTIGSHTLEIIRCNGLHVNMCSACIIHMNRSTRTRTLALLARQITCYPARHGPSGQSFHTTLFSRLSSDLGRLSHSSRWLGGVGGSGGSGETLALVALGLVVLDGRFDGVFGEKGAVD